MGSTDDSIDDIISYVAIILGTLFSLLNIIIILANHASMLKNVYAWQMLIIQTLHFLACFTVNPLFYFTDNLGWCQAGGALFYLFWIASNLCSEYLLFIILQEFKNQRNRYLRFQRWVYLAIAAISAAIAFVPISTYEPVEIADHYVVYCGSSPIDQPGRQFTAFDAVLLLVYVVPIGIGIILLVLLCRARGNALRKQAHEQMTKEERHALNMLFIPVANLMFVIINAVVYSVEDKLSGARHVYIVLTRLIHFQPVVNYLFFIKFVANLESEDMEITRLRFLFCMGRQRDYIDNTESQQGLIS